jgi:2-keto-4-pentenoate hydratase/2-oxohepta-3-ene-1,7-dioic acid hydratase in catechol pathway
MRLCRFGDSRLGLVDGQSVRDVTAALDALPPYRYPLPEYDVLVANLDVLAPRIRAIASQAPPMPLDGLTLLSPIANPGKIVAAPVNYHKHLDEVRGDAALHHNNPGHTLTIHNAGVFLKATSSLVGAGQGIVVRMDDRRTDHEVELAFVIGRTADRVSAADALSYVAGYAIGLDITIRGSEDRSFRKSADTYTVLGPWLVTADEIPDPGSLDLRLELNGELRQQSNTRHLILGVPQLIELASSFYTLHPGDVILTGTPEGVSPIEPGDRVVAAIDCIGTMSVAVRGSAAAAVGAMSGAASGQEYPQ